MCTTTKEMVVELSCSKPHLREHRQVATSRGLASPCSCSANTSARPSRWLQAAPSLTTKGSAPLAEQSKRTTSQLRRTNHQTKGAKSAQATPRSPLWYPSRGQTATIKLAPRQARGTLSACAHDLLHEIDCTKDCKDHGEGAGRVRPTMEETPTQATFRTHQV